MSDESFRCPDCGAEGVHSHPTDKVRSCDECGYAAGEGNFEQL